MDLIKELCDEMNQLKENGLALNIRTLQTAQGPWLEIENKKVLNMCSNNYLDFANRSELKEAAKKAVDEWGVGPGAVRSIAGTLTIHEKLEKELADFKNVEATLVLQSGFNANQAVIAPITGENDAILSDELNHASIIDGVRLSKAKRYVWAHKDHKDLEAQLQKAKSDGARRMLVITDGVFSMDGDIAPLPQISEVCKKYEAMLMVDDAHGEGVLGKSGRGIVDHFHLHGQVDIEVGTLSKAFGIVGGFVAGKKGLIEYLKNKARPFLFSSSLSPAETGAALAALEILKKSDEPVRRLWENADYFKTEMKKMGFDIGNSVTPITPVMLYEASTAKEFSKKLFEEGVFASSIGFPTVPKGKARIRVMISAGHSKEDLKFALSKFEKIGREMKVIK
ncbi:MAG TPA: glycine C-acetyltransferase [Petrotogaceae bacterium]|nr:glycine C-acetyltransferase [Petrotogaceae bacterium]